MLISPVCWLLVSTHHCPELPPITASPRHPYLNLVQGAQCPVTRLQSISRTGESEDTCARLYPELMLQEDGSVYSFSLIKSPNLDWSV